METEPEPLSTLLCFLLQAVQVDYSFLTVAFVSMGILIVCSAMISASENAFFSLSPGDLALLREEKNNSSRRAVALISEPEPPAAARRLLATILILNNFVNITIIILASLSLDDIWLIAENNYQLQPGPVLRFAIEVGMITFLLVLFGEVIPKIYATQNNLQLVRLMASPLHYCAIVLKPVVIMLTGMTRTFDRLVRQSTDSVSLEELNKAIEIASEDDNIEEKNILKGLVNFGNISVKQIMRPRMDVSALDITLPAEALYEKVTEWGYSRIPIFRETFDHVEGILYIKDLIPTIHSRDSIPWQNLIRQPFFVPENKKIDDLLEEFQEKHIHMAIVVDEYGGSSGIVTMEDILEEIFGEMADEFDEDEIVYSKLDESTYIFEGKVLLTDLVKIFELMPDHFDEIKGDADTLGGLIMEIGQSIPTRGVEVQCEGFRFMVESADKRRIKRVKVIRSVESNASEPAN